MTADEFGKILDRLHKAIQEVSVIRDPECPEDHPSGLADLDQVWRDLNDHRALMLAEEQRLQRMREKPQWQRIVARIRRAVTT